MLRKMCSMILFLFVSFLIAEGNPVVNLLDKFSYRTYSENKDNIRLEKQGSFRGYNLDGEFVEDYFTRIAIDSEKDVVYLYTNSQNPMFLKFDANEFAKDSILTPLAVFQKNKGQGPNDLLYGYITDMQFDVNTQKLYFIEPSARSVFIYDSLLNEVDRIKLDFRPYKFNIYDGNMYLTKYDGGVYSGYCVAELDLDTKKVKNLFPCEKLSSEENLEYSGRTTFFIKKINDDKFMVSRQSPDFKIFLCDESKIDKAFASPKLAKPMRGFPKPKNYIDEQGIKRVKAIMAYKDMYYDYNKNILFTLSGGGSNSLSKEYGLTNFISIFNQEVTTLCEYQLYDGEIYGGELGQLLYDHKRDILYLVSDKNEEIVKYKVLFK